MVRQVSALRKPVVSKQEEKAPFPIEKGIPIPPDTRSKKYNFGFDKLKMNESVFVPLVADLTPESQRQNIIRYYKMEVDATEGEKAFTCRKAEKDGVEGFRVWRIEA